MITQIFSVYDSKTKAYFPPMYFPTIGAAIRTMEDTLLDQDNQITRHPEDYTLFHIGEWNDENATITMLKTAVKIGIAHEFIRQHEMQLINGA